MHTFSFTELFDRTSDFIVPNGGVDEHRLLVLGLRVSPYRRRLGDANAHTKVRAYLRGELGDGLGALRDGVLGELTGEDKADGSLDLAGGQSGLLVEAGELAGLSGDALEDVVDEGVEDSNALLGDADLCNQVKQ